MVELDAKPTSPESTPARRYERTPAWPPMAKRREKSALTLDERPDERPNERQGEKEGQAPKGFPELETQVMGLLQQLETKVLPHLLGSNRESQELG